MAEHSEALALWESFYVIVGSSGGALIGLQFVVIALVADRHNASIGSMNAFGTPTVVHFTCALAVSAIMSAPWPTLNPLSMALMACGFAGIGYGVVVIRRARRQRDYQPVFEDWIWYLTLPCIVYAGLLASAIWLHEHHESAFFGIAACSLALLMIGIHNAWDSVTHIALVLTPKEQARPASKSKPTH